MNKSILFILIFYGSVLVFAPIQLSAQGKYQIGLTVGLGVSSMHDRTPNDKRRHVHTGILGSYTINEKFKLQPALLISTKGYGSTFINPDTWVNLTYIDAIITLKYYPWKIFFVGLGPQVGYLNKAKYRYENNYNTIDIKGVTYDFDYGLNGSLGFQFKSGIGLELATVYGLRRVFNQHSNNPVLESPFFSPVYIPAQAKGKNTVFSISFYCLFGKKQKQN